MDIIRECRYLYRIPPGDDWYPDGHYGSLMAISMDDARKHLRGKPRREIVRVWLGEDGCDASDHGSQEFRKMLFDNARRAKFNRRR